jgi:hypothetical protein
MPAKLDILRRNDLPVIPPAIMEQKITEAQNIRRVQGDSKAAGRVREYSLSILS